MSKSLVEKIREKTAFIAVVGLGQIGLLTATMLATKGYRVIGVEVKKENLNAILSLKSVTKEPGLNNLLKKVLREGTFKATNDVARAVEKTDISIICVQTPLHGKSKPNLTYLKKACEDISKRLSTEKLVLIESTLPPGTTTNLV